VAVPLDQRGLLSTAEMQQSLTIDRLIGAMDAAWKEAARVVTAVDKAWNTLQTTLSGTSTEIQQLEKTATRWRGQERELAPPRPG